MRESWCMQSFLHIMCWSNCRTWVASGSKFGMTGLSCQTRQLVMAAVSYTPPGAGEVDGAGDGETAGDGVGDGVGDATAVSERANTIRQQLVCASCRNSSSPCAATGQRSADTRVMHPTMPLCAQHAHWKQHEPWAQLKTHQGMREAWPGTAPVMPEQVMQARARQAPGMRSLWRKSTVKAAAGEREGGRSNLRGADNTVVHARVRCICQHLSGTVWLEAMFMSQHAYCRL